MLITQYLVHFVARGSASVRPVCGEWTRSVNWTTLAGATTCPECLAKLGAAARSLRDDTERSSAARP